VREDWLAARKLSLDQVNNSLRAENVNIAGGSIIEGDVEYLVRTLNQFTTVEELAALRIRRADGVVVRLADVAHIYETHKEREVISHLDGNEAVEIEVFKEADANVVDVARRVKEELFGVPGMDELDEDTRAMLGIGESVDDKLPDGVTMVTLDDQAAFIELAVNNLRSTAILGGFFAVGVLFLFLRDFRATAIIGIAIPVSVVVGFAPLYLLGVSLNLMSLGGLALGIGMLVDNAVVVLESIQRYREEGLGLKQAAVKGTSAVAAAVVAMLPSFSLKRLLASARARRVRAGPPRAPATPSGGGRRRGRERGGGSAAAGARRRRAPFSHLWKP
jgi:HAE1 family hydrophobic/amphiphilic exporter-1